MHIAVVRSGYVGLAADACFADTGHQVILVDNDQHCYDEFAAHPYEVASAAYTLLILTEWEEFASLDLARLSTQLRYPIVVDGRNLYTPEEMTAHGSSYYSVGRTPALADGLSLCAG